MVPTSGGITTPSCKLVGNQVVPIGKAVAYVRVRLGSLVQSYDPRDYTWTLPAKPWTRNNVDRILVNPIYVGWQEVNYRENLGGESNEGQEQVYTKVRYRLPEPPIGRGVSCQRSCAIRTHDVGIICQGSSSPPATKSPLSICERNGSGNACKVAL